MGLPWRGVLLVIVGGALLSFSSGASTKLTEESLRALLDKAKSVSDIREPGSAPFHLRAVVRLYGSEGEITKGTYELWWQSPDQFREDAVFPAYAESKIIADGKLGRVRSLDYQPIRVTQLSQLMKYPEGFCTLGDNIKQLNIKETKGEKLTRVRWLEDKDCSRELVLDREAGAVRTSGVDAKDAFKGLAPFKGKLFPRILKNTEDGSPAVEVTVETLEEVKAHDKEIFVFPSEAVIWPWCREPTMAKPSREVKPRFPPNRLGHTQMADVTLFLILDREGRVVSANVTRKAGPEFEKSALDAVTQWRFEPARCGTEPIPSEHIVTIKFVSN